MGEIVSLSATADRCETDGNGTDWVVITVDNHSYHYTAESGMGRTDMEVLTQNNGWAIVWMHEKYFVRHIKPEGCGTFLRGNATVGCTCKGKHKAAPLKVDDVILAKFRLLTLKEKLK